MISNDAMVEFVIVLGADGQVGRALTDLLTAQKRPHMPLSRLQCDVTDLDNLRRRLHHACFVVNCAAFTAVDQAEREIVEAYRINQVGAGNVAQACADAKIPLLHLSTDYVFDGASKSAYREDDTAHPINVYGQSKYAGELAIRRSHSQHIILRTSWVFSQHGRNFVTTIARLARQQSVLRIVADQIGGPTPADDIANAIIKIIDLCSGTAFSDWGIYHFSGAPPVSWYEIARTIVSGRDIELLPIATGEYPTAARRPQHTVLNCARIRRVFGIEQPNWRLSLVRTLRTLDMHDK